MKRILLTLFAVVLAFSAVAQQSDEEMVRTTLNYYLEGGTNNDFQTLEKAFHVDATMKYIASDGYREVNAISFFRDGMKPGPKQDRETIIESVDISGNAAHAKLVIKYKNFSFIDYMNLLKIDGEWKIVSKIFYRASQN